MPNIRTNSSRLETLDALRGLASLAVCWFHITNGYKGLLNSSGAYGWLGVEMFFVISGFVIPYALWKGSYQLKDFGRFLIKRVCRIDPPYLVSIGLVILLWEMSALMPGFQGKPYQFSLMQVLLHVGYLNAFFDVPWLSPVYWTLAIEFQYYLLLGLVFPLLVHVNASVRNLSVLFLLALGFVVPRAIEHAQNFLVIQWMVLFLMGIITFQYWVKLLDIRGYLVGMSALSVIGYFQIGFLPSLVGLTTGLVIVFIRIRSRILLFLGMISYSLYLTHTMIGGRVVNFSGRYAHDESSRWLVALLAVLISVAFASKFYWIVEKPTQRWAACFAYKKVIPEALAMGKNQTEQASLVARENHWGS